MQNKTGVFFIDIYYNTFHIEQSQEESHVIIIFYVISQTCLRGFMSARVYKRQRQEVLL